MRRGLNAHVTALVVAATLGTAAHAADLPSRYGSSGTDRGGCSGLHLDRLLRRCERRLWLEHQ